MAVSGRKAITIKETESEESFEFVCGPCSIDGINLQAGGYCADCGDYLCVSCYNCHVRPLPCRHHVLLDKNTMPKETVSTTVRDTCTERCPKHFGKFIEYACPIHDHLGCSACITVNHRNCEGVTYIPDEVDGIVSSQEFVNFKTKLTDMGKSIDDNQRKTIVNESEAEENHTRTMAEVEMFRRDIDICLDNLEKVTYTKIKKLKDQNIASMHIIADRCDSLATELHSLLDNIDSKLSLNQRCNLYVVMKRAKRSVEIYEATVEEICKDNEIKRYEFQPEKEILKVMKTTETFGSVSKVQMEQDVKVDTGRDSRQELEGVIRVNTHGSNHSGHTDLGRDRGKGNTKNEIEMDTLPTKSENCSKIKQIDASPRLVIAIDFGTFDTGYALQWKADFSENRLKIHCNTKWTAEGFSTYKTPTCLLLKPNKDIADFGYQAEKTFSLLGTEEYEEEKQADWFFFRHFKMLLYHREYITDETPVEEAHGKSLPVIEVFSKSIQYMKDHAINHLKSNGLPYTETKTKWVITVPAIWNDQAKKVMRRSAEKAGIKSELLSIALDPECAVIYCSQMPVDQLEIEGDEGKLKYVAAPGSTVMVVDMGEGTLDITTVQINPDSTMKQVYMSGGGPWGGMKVEQKFLMMLKDVVGDNVMKAFAENNRMDEYDLRMDFESKKREVKHPTETNANERFRIKLPLSLKELWEETTGKKVTKILESREDLQNVKFMSGRLSFKADVIREFFKETIDEIIKYVEKILNNPEHEGLAIDSMILVGGFAESNLVVRSIREGLKGRGIPVVRPQSTELAVLNGAVLFGQNEDILTSRIMRYTYGIGMIMEFVPSKHKKEKKFEDKGKAWATDVFRKHVVRGQEVKLGQWVSNKEYYPIDEKQESATLYLYASDLKDPIHTDEPGCKYIGQLEVKFSDPTAMDADGRPRRAKAVEVAMNFGGTEVKIKARDKTLGKVFQKSLKLQ